MSILESVGYVLAVRALVHLQGLSVKVSIGLLSSTMLPMLLRRTVQGLIYRIRNRDGKQVVVTVPHPPTSFKHKQYFLLHLNSRFEYCRIAISAFNFARFSHASFLVLL
jgi:hypothetical protein